MSNWQKRVTTGLALSLLTFVGAACRTVPIREVDAPPAARLPVHPWHKERVENIRKEEIEEVIENLANFDDMHFATTSSEMGFSPGNPESEMHRLTHLFRVRRLLEEGRKAPELVVHQLRKALGQALADWPEAFQQELELWEEAEKLSRGLIKDEPSAHDKARVKAAAATYLLAELQDHESLPLLWEGYKLQDKWIAEISTEDYRFIAQCPVPPPISLYAMHRLVSTYPLDQLPPAARAAHKRYMEWTQKHIPPPKKFTVTGSTANYDESDPRVRILDPEGVVLRHQPKMELVAYPDHFADGAPMQAYDSAPYITDTCNEWFSLMEAFAQAAFGKEGEQ